MNNRGAGDDPYWNETYDEWVGRIWRKILKGVGLFVIITLGVTCGNLASDYISFYVASVVAEREAKEAAERLKTNLERMRLENEEQARERKQKLDQLRAKQDRETQQHRVRQEKRAAVRKKLRDTCLFWQGEYRRTGKEMDRIHRDNACRDAGVSVN